MKVMVRFDFGGFTYDFNLHDGEGPMHCGQVTSKPSGSIFLQAVCSLLRVISQDVPGY